MDNCFGKSAAEIIATCVAGVEDYMDNISSGGHG